MKDLTKGNISKVLLQFAIPILIGQIVQLFYGLTDTWVIGRLLGDNALASVASVTPISDLIVGFLIGITNGFAVIAARFYGAKEPDKLNKSFAATLTFGTAITLALTVLSVTFLPQILNLINMSKEHQETGTEYIKVILFSMIISMLYNVFASTLRAIGDTIAPLIFLIVSAILNIILDFLFIGPLNMGVAGASIATLLAQLVSVILCVFYIKRKYPILNISIKSFSFNKQLVNQLLASGLSMGLMSSLVFLGTLILQSSINTFSTNIIVAHYAARKLTSIFMMPFGILGMTMASYCSQNFGARKFDRIKAGIKQSLAICLVWYIIVLAVTYTIVPYLIKGITSSNVSEVIDTATLYLRIDSLLYFVAAAISILRNSLQGIGEYITPIVSSTIELIGKFLAVLFLAPRLQYMGIIITEPIVWVVMVIPLIIKIKNSQVFKE